MHRPDSSVTASRQSMTDPNAFSPRLMHDARAILRLGSPLLIANLSVAGMMLADTLMSGRLGGGALAAVAVGSSYYSVFMILGLGSMTALSPLVAHAYGAGRGEAVGAYARQAVWVGLALAAVLLSGLALVRPVLAYIGTDASVIPDAVGYVHAVSAGIPGMLGFHALRAVSEGLGRTRPMMVVGVLGLATNVAGNWVFMYGKFGMPALGAVGTGVATAIVQWVMCAAMVAHVARHPAYRPYRILGWPGRPDRARLGEIVRLGVPIGGSMIAEAALFAASGLLVSTLGAAVVAAHQVALNWAAFMFMAPVSVHSATTIHVGHALGRGDRAAARRAGFTGIGLCALLMFASALMLSFSSDSIAAFYTADPAVRAVAGQLLLLAAVFQVSDGLQVGAMGALRGFKDARVPLVITIGSYWVVGFPLALYGGIVRGGGPSGVWWGLIAGLTVSAALLNLRYARISRA
jgi:MATE family multidrug resistance protein